MINNSNREQLIQQYIQGELSAQDTQEFEALMAKNTTLRNEVALQREILDNIEDALHFQEIEDIFEEVALEQKEFIRQTAKQTYARNRRNNGWKNWIILLIAGGALITGGVLVAKQYRYAHHLSADKASTAQAMKLPTTVVQNQARFPNKTSDTLSETTAPSNTSTIQFGGKQTKQPSANKDPKLQTASPLSLPPLSKRLDSLPELRFNQGLGYGKRLETNTHFRLVYFYNRLPEANQPQQQVFYQFQDTLRFYGPIGNPQKLHLLFNPRQGEYALVTPQDTVPLQYRESAILPLRKKK